MVLREEAARGVSESELDSASGLCTSVRTRVRRRLGVVQIWPWERIRLRLRPSSAHRGRDDPAQPEGHRTGREPAVAAFPRSIEARRRDVRLWMSCSTVSHWLPLLLCW
ncbi:serine/arginine-rich splicing factor SR45-like [Iris pallida]|uniref:Serine/arginine-rich splicing factor SR45-like n=1 Tax=Iris pallida TaxID=29817 RepID=A0AAX6FKZ9_IRIPA|nr:serine/arginine-rich splicing factor SR45-like [Iris pallida]